MTGSVPSVPLTTKAPVAPMDINNSSALMPSALSNGGWDWLNGWGAFTRIQEPFTGAWQRNQELNCTTVLTYYAVYACINLIASDIGKLRLRLIKYEDDDEEIFTEENVPAFSPVLRVPNRYQTRQQFIEHWMCSKLIAGNTYVLKGRSDRNTVEEMHILHPGRVRPMVSELDGSIWYQCSFDPLSGLQKQDALIPDSEIIHDRFPPLGGHPLCGVSPITACGLAALQGLNIQRSSNILFANGARPSGTLTAPGTLSKDTTRRMKEDWETNYSGNNVGKIAVLSDGLKYESIQVSASDSQLIGQLKMTAEMVCTAFLVPPHKISIGQMPNYNNIEALDQNYYSGCLQKHIESIEALLDKGLGLEKTSLPYATNFCLDDLLKMDTSTKIKTYGDAVKGGIYTTNEAREKFGLGEKPGGDAVLVQQQMFSIEAIAKRDAKDDPFASKGSATGQPGRPATPAANNNEPAPEQIPNEPQKLLPPPDTDWSRDTIMKGLRNAGA